MEFLLLALVLNPHVVSKARKQMDEVVGLERLPNFDDRDRLPYIDCIVWETMRWHPIFPMGVPHFSTEDDEYNGMLIEKGSVIIANTR